MMIKEKLSNEIKDAMRAKDARTLGTLRLISAAFKQIEVDERIEVTDDRALIVLDKMAKQRYESIAQFRSANRQDLIDQEEFELNLISRYLPEPFSDDVVIQVMNEAIVELGASKMSDMSRVMAYLKPKLQGRADMGKLSSMVKERLN